MSPFPRVERAVMLRVRAKHGHVCFKTSQQHVTKTPTRTQQHTNPYSTQQHQPVHPVTPGWRGDGVSLWVGRLGLWVCVRACMCAFLLQWWACEWDGFCWRFCWRCTGSGSRMHIWQSVTCDHASASDVQVPVTCKHRMPAHPSHPSNLEGIRTNLEESSKCQPPKQSH